MKKSFYCSNNNMNYAGKHLLIEAWEAKNINSIPVVERALREAVNACGATLLKIDLHKFSPFDGISGVAIISESHLSIHSWPEYSYAALDIFVCGDVDPYKAIPVFQEYFETKSIQIMEIKRGIMEVAGERQEMVSRDAIS